MKTKTFLLPRPDCICPRNDMLFLKLPENYGRLDCLESYVCLQQPSCLGAEAENHIFGLLTTSFRLTSLVLSTRSAPGSTAELQKPVRHLVSIYPSVPTNPLILTILRLFNSSSASLHCLILEKALKPTACSSLFLTSFYSYQLPFIPKERPSLIVLSSVHYNILLPFVSNS